MARTTEQLIKDFNKTPRKFGDFHVLKAGTRGFYDVFTKDTWENHTRVHFDRKTKVTTEVSGLKLKDQLKKVNEILINLNGKN
jgi:hypothetical protein